NHTAGVLEPGLHGRVLARRALAVVLVSDSDPRHAALTAMAGGVGIGLDVAVHRAPARAGLAREGIDGAEEQVAGDVLQMTAVAQPLAGGRDVVGGALALRLHQHGELDVVVSVPR